MSSIILPRLGRVSCSPTCNLIGSAYPPATQTPVVSCSCLLDLLGQGGNSFVEVGNGLILRHYCLSICRSCRRKVDEDIVHPIHIFYVVCSVVSPPRVNNFCFLLYSRCAAWACACKFAQVFLSRCLSLHLSQSSYNRPVLYMSV